jgi:hypothetical protein
MQHHQKTGGRERGGREREYQEKKCQVMFKQVDEYKNYRRQCINVSLKLQQSTYEMEKLRSRLFEKIITSEKTQSDKVTKRKDNIHITNTSNKSDIITNYMDSNINNLNEPIQRKKQAVKAHINFWRCG